MSRTADELCLICGKRIKPGNAVYCVGVNVSRGENFNGRLEVRIANRNPRGIMHDECMVELLEGKKSEITKKRERKDGLKIDDGFMEWD